MKKTKQLIAFQRDKFLTTLKTPQKPEGSRLKLIQALSDELLRYGYFMAPETVLYLSEDDVKEVYSEVIPFLIDKYHSGEAFKCLYPGFPEQVLSMSDEALERNAQAIYDGLVDIDEFMNQWYTDAEKINASKTGGCGETIIKRMTEEEFMTIPRSIMLSGNSIQAETKAELCWFLRNYHDLPIPDRIPFKETLCMVMMERPEYEPRDINDILRFGIYLMGGDPALLCVPKEIRSNSWTSTKTANPDWRNLKSLPRQWRKIVLEKLDRMVSEKGLDYLIPDAKRFYGHWILLSERVHSGDYKNQYPKAREFFTTLQDKTLRKKYRTWYSKLQKMYDSGKDIVEISKFISSHPGEFVRRFDSLLRKARPQNKESDIMDVFLETPDMKNKTLIELLSYYDKRNGAAPRFVSVKGSNRKYPLPALTSLSHESIEFTQDIIIGKILKNIDSRITEKDLVGVNVYIDPDLKNIPVPRNMRSASNIIPPGTKFNIPEDKDIIRFFVHWIQNGRAEDLDLHAYFVDSELKTARNIGWNTGLRNQFAVHSGDVLNREGDCAEYCDCCISKAVDAGYRYLVMDVYNYKGRDYTTLDSWLGFSYRTKLEGGDQNWIPCEQVVCEKITAKSSQVAAWLFDLVERKAILLGVELNSIPVTEGSQQNSIIKYFTTKATFSTYDVVCQNYKSRGANVLSELPASDSDIIVEKVTAADLVKDYTKVLEMIGE